MMIHLINHDKLKVIVSVLVQVILAVYLLGTRYLVFAVLHTTSAHYTNKLLFSVGSEDFLKVFCYSVMW